MVQLIIFGTTGITMTKDRGQFCCPQCGTGKDYKHKRVRRFFTLYFIPIIPLDLIGEYVECLSCQGTFHLDILQYDAADTQRSFQALFMVAMRQTMIAMLLADGVVDDDEIKELQQMLNDLVGVEIPEQEIREEVAEVQRQGSSVIELASQLANGLNDKGKEMVIVAAYQIASADGHIDDSERQLMTQIAEALGISRAHLGGILAELEHPTATNNLT